ncbi:WecB/TagA/CpsF family glycosyltransferase [Actinoplanes sp. NPDC051851]|uniref:WecB/TagA/CpsF family glycosyltransferase n=1 Tax=Actinoplanes sp. NPDC051851 TaxID=3154753 RepID=UPI003426977B
MGIEAFERVHLDGTGIDRITEDEVVAVVRDALAHRRGGRIVTPNVDILRRAAADPEARRHLDDADLIVADGMPLIWASRLGGSPLPERVAGSSLIWSLSQGLGRDGRSIFVIGGRPTTRKVGSVLAEDVARLENGVDRFAADVSRLAAQVGRLADAKRVSRFAGAERAGRLAGAERAGRLAGVEHVGRVAGVAGEEGWAAEGRLIRPARPGLPLDGAERCAARLVAASPGLRIAGTISPAFGFERDEEGYAMLCARVADARPDLVFVGLGFPKQERVIERLRPDMPATWFVGCGAAVDFVAGDVERAPRWMQRTGLEWAHRLGTEPRRLARRYLRDDAPYALRLLARARRRDRRV